MNLDVPGRLSITTRACAAAIFAMMALTGASGGAPPPNLFTYAIPQGPQGIYSDTWIVGINEVGIQIPATSIVANLPDAPSIVVPLLNWQRRCCYIYSPGSPYDEAPDPDMPQDQFQWSWYGQGLSVSVYLGYVSGYVSRNVSEVYQINPLGVEIALLGRVMPNGGPSVGDPAMAVPATASLPLLALAMSVMLLARRRFTMPVRNG